MLRRADESVVKKWEQVKSLEYETLHRARKIIDHLGLSMKLSDVDYQGDRTKATFYYTAEERVDFRELIRKLAEAFRVRIEMRRSEEHTSELQSLMRISYAVFCFKKKKQN